MRKPNILINDKPWWTQVNWSLMNIEIADIVGISATTVKSRRHKLGLSNSTKKRDERFKQNASIKMKGNKNREVNDLDYEWPNKSKKGTKPTSRFSWAAKRTWGEACEYCSYQKEGISNHVHHIIPRSEGGKHTIRNSCILCSRCHEEIHAGILKLSENIMRRLNNE